MRLKTVGKLGGIESLVLDAPGEDDGGQRLNQLLPENSILGMRYQSLTKGLGKIKSVLQNFSKLANSQERLTMAEQTRPIH